MKIRFNSGQDLTHPLFLLIVILEVLPKGAPVGLGRGPHGDPHAMCQSPSPPGEAHFPEVIRTSWSFLEGSALPALLDSQVLNSPVFFLNLSFIYLFIIFGLM